MVSFSKRKKTSVLLQLWSQVLSVRVGIYGYRISGDLNQEALSSHVIYCVHKLLLFDFDTLCHCCSNAIIYLIIMNGFPIQLSNYLLFDLGK